MTIKLYEKTIEDIRPELRDLYVKKNGKYQLQVADLDQHVATKLRPLQQELDAMRVSEWNGVVRTGLEQALKRADVVENGADILIERLAKRVSMNTSDGKRVVVVLGADGGTPQPGAVGLDDLVVEAKKQFPSMFGVGRDVPKNVEGPTARSKADFKSEKDRAAFVNTHGVAAYEALPQSIKPAVIKSKADFASERDRARWGDRHGLAAYNKLLA